ncbi:MAG: hypothetical protein IPL25_14040 [Saprospiraceae bacterium]|nr:hypothetical protein [Candidatus Vicinibacter affinis]
MNGVKIWINGTPESDLAIFRQINQAYEEAMFQRNKLATYQTPEGKFQEPSPEEPTMDAWKF